MSIEQIEPYLLDLLAALQQISADNAVLLEQMFVLKSVLAIVIFMMGFLGGLLFMRVFWERFK